MPHFVYQVKPFAQFQKLADIAAFRDASAHARAVRAARTDPTSRLRVMLAHDEQRAEGLLCQICDPAPAGDD